MSVYLVVFDDMTTTLVGKIYSDLEKYIDQNYVEDKCIEEYGDTYFGQTGSVNVSSTNILPHTQIVEKRRHRRIDKEQEIEPEDKTQHASDTFSQYLMYLIEEKKMKNADVDKNAYVDKKVFSKIKNNVNYHPQKLTALSLCMGARLTLDETKDLLARAGYALSPCDKTDLIFSYFITNANYDISALEDQLWIRHLPTITKEF